MGMIPSSSSDAAQSMYSRAVELCSNDRQLDLSRLYHVYAGALAETLIDFEHVHEELSFSLWRIKRRINLDIDILGAPKNTLPSPLTIDFETEMGRGLSRLYLDGSHGTAQNVVSAIEIAITDTISRVSKSKGEAVQAIGYFSSIVDMAVTMEHATHQLCDDLIEIKIARQGWNLGDCIQGLSALSGRRLALEDDCATSPFELKDLAHIMGQEALRLGVGASFDVLRGMAANDAQFHLPLGLVGALEPMCLETLNRYNLILSVDQAAVLSKAAGRLIAVASSGDMPEIEPVVARPIALSAMTCAYHKFLA